MTIADRQAGDGGETLAREAAHWFARMRSPEAENSRADFEAWLGQSSGHLAAYNRSSEIFAMGKLLAAPATPAPPAPRRKVPVAAVAMVGAVVLGLAGWALWQPGRVVPDRSRAVAALSIDARTIATVAGETRVVSLADGSTVRLGEDTALLVDIAAGRRDLKLLRGTARFEVAHEPRPFVVRAGGGSVTARGTIFEIAFARSGEVDVRLLRGAVDVALPRRWLVSQPPVRKLAAGESVSFAAVNEPETIRAARPGAAAPAATSAVRDYAATPVADLIALANRGAARPIRLADPSLGAQRVSGRFRVDDTALLARRLGALFGRSVDMDDPREIVLAASPAPPGRPASSGKE